MFCACDMKVILYKVNISSSKENPSPTVSTPCHDRPQDEDDRGTSEQTDLHLRYQDSPSHCISPGTPRFAKFASLCGTDFQSPLESEQGWACSLLYPQCPEQKKDPSMLVKSVVLHWGHSALPPRDIRQCLETFLIVPTGEEGATTI